MLPNRCALALLAGLIPLRALAQEPPASPPVAVAVDPLAANKTVVRRYIDEVLSAGRLDALGELLSPDFKDSTPGAAKDVRGPEVVRTSQAKARAIFPEVQYTVDDLIAEGDRVVARYSVRARSKGSEEQPGRLIEVTGITIFRVADGRIREAWIINDQIEMFLQLGYSLQPPQ